MRVNEEKELFYKEEVVAVVYYRYTYRIDHLIYPPHNDPAVSWKLL